MARPSKLTREVQETICAAVEEGVSFETACEVADVAAATGWEWLARGMGRDPDRPSSPEFAEFAEALTRARARAEMREVQLIVKHAETDWRAAAWMLERRAPERYGRNPVQRIELAGDPDAPIEVQHRHGLKIHDVLRLGRELGLIGDDEIDELRAIEPQG
jgi:hypothetical protein